MIYKHKYFVLDTESKKVFDENKKELRLTGNAYRMLVFLCKNKNANLTEIGEYLDWAKDYNEDHIRQYRYKINTIIGYDIVGYKNGVYSLVGRVEEKEKLDRNTDLLQQKEVKLEKNNMNKEKETKATIIPAVIAIILLFLTFLDWSYGYYTFLRFVVATVVIYYLYVFYTLEKLQTFWFWVLIVIAVLFNPIIPVHLGDKMIWGVIDVIVAMFFLSLIIRFSIKNNKLGDINETKKN